MVLALMTEIKAALKESSMEWPSFFVLTYIVGKFPNNTQTLCPCSWPIDVGETPHQHSSIMLQKYKTENKELVDIFNLFSVIFW